MQSKLRPPTRPEMTHPATSPGGGENVKTDEENVKNDEITEGELARSSAVRSHGHHSPSACRSVGDDMPMVDANATVGKSLHAPTKYELPHKRKQKPDIDCG